MSQGHTVQPILGCLSSSKCLLVLQGQTLRAHRVHGKLLSQPRPPTERGPVPTYIDVVGIDVVRVGITQQRVQLHSVTVIWRARGEGTVSTRGDEHGDSTSPHRVPGHPLQSFCTRNLQNAGGWVVFRSNKYKLVEVFPKMVA